MKPCACGCGTTFTCRCCYAAPAKWGIYCRYCWLMERIFMPLAEFLSRRNFPKARVVKRH